MWKTIQVMTSRSWFRYYELRAKLLSKKNVVTSRNRKYALCCLLHDCICNVLEFYNADTVKIKQKPLNAPLVYQADCIFYNRMLVGEGNVTSPCNIIYTP